MNKLIIDTLEELEDCRSFAPLFEFYPYGFKGLVTDILLHHLKYLRTNDEVDKEMIDHVLQRYHESPEYLGVYAMDAEGAAREMAIIAATYIALHTLVQITQQYRKELLHSKLEADAIDLGSSLEYLLVELV